MMPKTSPYILHPTEQDWILESNAQKPLYERHWRSQSFPISIALLFAGNAVEANRASVAHGLPKNWIKLDTFDRR